MTSNLRMMGNCHSATKTTNKFKNPHAVINLVSSSNPQIYVLAGSGENSSTNNLQRFDCGYENELTNPMN